MKYRYDDLKPPKGFRGDYENVLEEKKRQQRLLDYKRRNAFTPLSTEPKRYRFVSFDVETVTSNNDFYLCGVLDYNNEYHAFYDKQEAIDFLRRLKHNDLIVVATNLEFDFSVLFKDSKLINSCDFIVNGGRFIMVKMKGTYTPIRFYDTLNYGGFSVEKMGEILGVPKLQHPACLGRVPRNKKEKEELVVYNKRDCEVTKRFMSRLQGFLLGEGSELKPTVSGCAMDLYRRKYLKFDMTREEITTGLKVKEKIHKAYYGGRTEVLKRGLMSEEYYYYDVNSLYPFCMLNDYPVPDSMNYIGDVSRYGKDWYKRFLSREGVSFFKLHIPYTKYPLLPYRHNQHLVFPYGYFSGYYTHLEIRRAVELYGEKIIIEMSDVMTYERTFPLFRDFIRDMYAKRLKSKEEKSDFEVFYKLMMNSTYGRFAMRNLQDTDIFIPESDDDVFRKLKSGGDKSVFKIIRNDLSYMTTPKEYDGNSSFPILSCYVTAYARILMHRYMLETEPVYMDTDSLFTRKKIKTGKELGELKLESIIPKSRGILIKPKLYLINDKLKAKGVRIPKDVDKQKNLMDDILSGKPVSYEKFVKIKEGVKRGLKVNSIIVVEKNIDLEDVKRDWNGKSFILSEFQDSEPLFIDEGFR